MQAPRCVLVGGNCSASAVSLPLPLIRKSPGRKAKVTEPCIERKAPRVQTLVLPVPSLGLLDNGRL